MAPVACTLDSTEDTKNAALQRLEAAVGFLTPEAREATKKKIEKIGIWYTTPGSITLFRECKKMADGIEYENTMNVLNAAEEGLLEFNQRQEYMYALLTSAAFGGSNDLPIGIWRDEWNDWQENLKEE